MGYPRSDSADGVVAGLVTGQVHEHPRPPSVDQRQAEVIPVPRTFEHGDVDTRRLASRRSRPGPI